MVETHRNGIYLPWHSPGCDPKAGVVFSAEHTKYGIPRWQSKDCIIPGKPGVNGGVSKVFFFFLQRVKICLFQHMIKLLQTVSNRVYTI